MSNDRKRSYTPITGNPNRSTKKSSKTKKSSQKKSGKRNRKRRVNVTPNDWEQVEAMAEELGLPYAKVYNVAFQALRQKLGHE